MSWDSSQKWINIFIYCHRLSSSVFTLPFCASPDSFHSRPTTSRLFFSCLNSYKVEAFLEILSGKYQFRGESWVFFCEMTVSCEISRGWCVASVIVSDFCLSGVGPDCCSQKGADLEGKAFDLSVDLRFNSHCGHELWVVTERSQLRWFGSGCLLGASHWRFSGHVQRIRRTWGRPRTPRSYTSHLVWEHLRILQEKLENVAGEKAV